MNFANAQALLLLPIGVALFGLTGFLYYLRQKKLAAWIDPTLWPTVIPEFKKLIFNLRFYSLVLAYLFLVIGLARPQWGEREEVFTGEGMDILVLLDLSNSMAAEDVAPSRLHRAQTFVKKLLPLLPHDRVGIVGFAESAYLAAPLTNDFGYITEMIETLSPGAIQNQGTNVGTAIETAVRAFERGAEDDRKNSRAMILITDGEDFGRGVRTAAERVKEFGTGFIVLSVGTTEGAPIPLRNEAGILQTYKRDSSGKPIVTRVNKDLASEVAAAAGGKYFELVNPDDAAYTVAKQLSAFGRGQLKEQRNVIRIDRFQYFLAIALAFYLIHLFIGYRRARIVPIIPRRWLPRPKTLLNPASKSAAKTAVMIALAILAAGASNPVRAQTLDSYLKSKKAYQEYKSGDFESSAKHYDSAHNADRDNATLEFNEATALSKAKRPDEALPHYQESTRKSLNQGDYAAAAKSLYNEGVTLHNAKKMDDAYDRLTKAIEMAKIANQPQVEQKAREALMAVAEQQQQQQDQKNDQQSKEGDGDGKDGKDGKDKKDQKDGDDKDKDDKNDPEKKNPPSQQGESRKKDFKSGTLSKDVAEGIMNDLSDREKQLYNKRLKDQKGREVPNEKDW